MQLRELKYAAYLNVGLAAWLLVSAFLWRHTQAQFLLTVLVGVIVALAATFEAGATSEGPALEGLPAVRKITATAGFALTLSALLLPRVSTSTFWNNALVGLAVAGVSILGAAHATRSFSFHAPAFLAHAHRR